MIFRQFVIKKLLFNCICDDNEFVLYMLFNNIAVTLWGIDTLSLGGNSFKNVFASLLKRDLF